eukprot:CAMPEP_0169332144 /NCGR_PEP_ID=MMETSP1017-20121227/14561_1 /TAXON_ID=342587 /ORGANISM="Karlodinium micrum, Strain CCMP2283" /LENGTH=258 /DNA_ID=CAMNT_0009427263 /DNA_START=15 /DNA_END=791 /DNA_ORIENTATION=-
MHIAARAFTIHLVVACVYRSRAARIQTNQLLNTLDHLGELVNTVNDTLEARLQMYANETLHDIATSMIAEIVRGAVLLGRSTSNTSRGNDTVLLDTDRYHGLPGAMGEFGLVFVVAIILVLLALFCQYCCCMKEGLREWISEKNDEGRQKYLYKGRVIYEWEQKCDMIICYTKLPKGTKSVDVDVQIEPKHLKISLHGKQPFISEELFSLVDDTRSTWQISSQGELMIHMKKAVEDEKWTCMIQAHRPSNIDESSEAS